jgi:Mg2+/Co2+ transporter CorB
MSDATLLVVGGPVLLALLGCSALFSSAEMAIFSLPPLDSAAPATGADGERSRLDDLRDDPHRLLVTLLVGNNVVNVAFASIVTVLAVSYLPAGIAVAAATAITSLVVIVFGEIVPKAYGLGQGRRWAERVAPMIGLVELALLPVVVVLDAVTSRVNHRLSGDEAIERPYLE